MKRSPICTLILILFPALLYGQAPYNPSQRPAVSPQSPAPLVKAAGDPVETFIAPREREILAEINLARTNPAQYLRYLEEFKPYYHGKEIKYSDGSTLITNEGVSALEEAITFVRSLKPLPPLVLRQGLILGARDHLNDLVKTGQSGHRGSDGSVPEDRLSRYGRWRDSVGENIVYRSRKAREDVIALLIDDGVKTRGHRKNIFKSEFQVIGLALSAPSKAQTMCVITFAGGFADKGNNTPLVPTAQKF